MTTIDTSADSATTDDPVSAGTTAAGPLDTVAAWLTSTDHKRIGRLFIGSSLVAMLAAAAAGIVLGIERTFTDRDVFDASAMPQVFAGFRVGLVSGVGIPLLVGLSVAIVPLQLGSRSMAFPRVAQAGFWAWAIGLVLVVVSLANNGGPGGGNADMVDLFLAAHGLLAVGLTMAAATVAATVLTSRAPGMTMRRLPVFSWSALVASTMLVLSLPVLLGVLIYLFVDHRNDRLAFGGNTGVGAWTAFAFTQPATYLMAIPALGLAAELIAVTFRRRLVGRGVLFAGLGLVGVAGLAAVTQQQLFLVEWRGSGLSLEDFGSTFDDLIPWALFLGLPLLGALLVLATGAITAAKALGGRATAREPDADGVRGRSPRGDTARGARPRLVGPFVFAFLGVGMVVTGMVGALAYPIADLGLVGTVFEEGAFVYVVYGSVLAGLGGIAYWAPKWWGRTLPDKPVLGLAGAGFVATVLASLPFYVAGFADQPAGAVDFDYGGPMALWNVAVLAGHALMFVTVAAFAALAVKTFTGDGEYGVDDPWEAHTLEWATSSPAPAQNFADVHTVASAEPLLDLRAGPDDPSSGHRS